MFSFQDHRQPSFISRLQDSHANAEKSGLAKLYLKHLFHGDEPLFVASGTTSYLIAIHLLSNVSGLQLWTNSAPLLNAYLEMQESGQIANHVSLHVIRGEVNSTTGIISAIPLGRVPTRILLYSPHGVTSRGVEGRRDISEIKAVIRAHGEIIMPVTWDKLTREASSIIKHLGHSEKEIRAGKRVYRVLLSGAMPAGWSQSHRTECSELLRTLASKGIEIIRDCDDSEESPT